MDLVRATTSVDNVAFSDDWWFFELLKWLGCWATWFQALGCYMVGMYQILKLLKDNSDFCKRLISWFWSLEPEHAPVQ